MIKYVPDLTSVVMEEIPDRVTIAVEISNCLGRCKGCHSPFLRKNIGEELSFKVIDKLISDNFGVDCFLLLGEGNDRNALIEVANYIRQKYEGRIKTAVYAGRQEVEDEIFLAFDYVKVGPFRPECGPLNSPTTNQRLYVVHRKHAERESNSIDGVDSLKTLYTLEDITSRFWHKGVDKSWKKVDPNAPIVKK